MTPDKWQKLQTETCWPKLSPLEKAFLSQQANTFHFSFQELKQLSDMAVDFTMWDRGPINLYWPDIIPENLQGKNLRKWLFSSVEEKWQQLKNEEKDYTGFLPTKSISPVLDCQVDSKEKNIIGHCPVDSSETRCCQLLTLDVVRNCAYSCSYCCLQPFFDSKAIVVEGNLKEKLQKIKLPPNELVHVGTGQSSDSLLWGNKEGILDSLMEWAQQNPLVILELKSKSDNISYFQNNKIPPNVIVTWAINSETIVNNEEHQTASLDKRLKAARLLAAQKTLVGFHFHPLVYYHGYERDYKEVIDRIIREFDPREVAMVSMGTLTYTPSVVQQIRRKNIKSKILQMPLVKIAGKLSYPYEIKKKLFQHTYQEFKPWHEKVFFYLCMEEQKLWPEILGYEYKNNEEFSQAMKSAYWKKIQQ